MVVQVVIWRWLQCVLHSLYSEHTSTYSDLWAMATVPSIPLWATDVGSVMSQNTVLASGRLQRGRPL